MHGAVCHSLLEFVRRFSHLGKQSFAETAVAPDVLKAPYYQSATLCLLSFGCTPLFFTKLNYIYVSYKDSPPINNKPRHLKVLPIICNIKTLDNYSIITNN